MFDDIEKLRLPAERRPNLGKGKEEKFRRRVAADALTSVPAGAIAR